MPLPRFKSAARLSRPPVAAAASVVEALEPRRLLTTMAHWRFDEPAGSPSVADASGHGNTLTLGSTAALTPGRLGNALTHSYGLAPAVVELNHSFTASVWTNATNGLLMSQYGADDSYFVINSVAGGAFQLFRLDTLDDDGHLVGSVITNPLPAGWKHIAAVNDSAANELRLYVNGTLQGSLPYTAGAAASGGHLGVGQGIDAAGVPNGRFPLAGQIDDVRLDDAALTAGEIQQLASPVSDLAVSASYEDAVVLSWNEGSTDETGFDIEVTPAGGTAFLVAAPAHAGTGGTSFEVPGLAAVTDYAFRVRVITGGGPGPFSDAVVQKTTTADLYAGSWRPLYIIGQGLGSPPPAAGTGIGFTATPDVYFGHNIYNTLDATERVRNATVSWTFTNLPRHQYVKVYAQAFGTSWPSYYGAHDAGNVITAKVNGRDLPLAAHGNDGFEEYLSGTNREDFTHYVDDSGTLKVEMTGAGYVNEAWCPAWVSVWTYLPAVSITPQGVAREGVSKETGSLDKLGFYLRTTNVVPEPLKIQLEYGGNAEIGKDVWGVPSQVIIPAGETEVFVPIGMTEDVIPEWAELFQVRVKKSSRFATPPPGQDYVSFKIEDDDQFYVGSYEAPEGALGVIVSEMSGGVVVESHTEEIPLEAVGTEFNAVFGLADGDWLPWLTGEQTSGGDPVTQLYDGSVDVLPTENPTFGRLTASAAVPGDPMVHARNLALLEEYKPGFTFEVTADGRKYQGTDAAGRITIFDLQLSEVEYRGTHKGFYLKFNDDGSIDKWGGEFVDKPALIGRVRLPDAELKQQLNLLKDKYFEEYNEQTEEHRVMREQFAEFADTLASLLQTGVSLAPGAIALDIEEAVTGHDPFDPSAQVSGGSRAVSAAGALPIVGAIKSAKKLLEAGERLRENWKAGQEFQKTVTAALEEIKYTKKLKVTLRSGKIYNTIPDIISVSGNSIIEIKRVNGLGSLTNQLEAQIQAAKERNMKYWLILGPDATSASVADSIKDEIHRQLGIGGAGRIVKFNPETRKLEHLWP